MIAQAAEVEQALLELVEERSRLASLLQEIEELRLNANVELNRRVYTDERAQRAEPEHKVMADRLARAEEEKRLLSEQLWKPLGDRLVAEDKLRSKQERLSQLSGELTSL